MVGSSKAYVADGSALRVIDVSTPTSPQEIDAYTTVVDAYDVYVAGSEVYVADRSGGLVVLSCGMSCQ